MPGQHPFEEVSPEEAFPCKQPERKFPIPAGAKPDKNLLWDYVFNDKLDDKSPE